MTDFYSCRLVRQGFWALLVALISGFTLIFSMIGGVSLSPIPLHIPVDIPGTTEGWRTVHAGMLMNALMAISIGSSVRLLGVDGDSSRKIFLGCSIAIWGNFCFYVFGMFAPNHGLTLQSNALGAASLSGALAFFPALLGAVSLIYVVVIVLLSKPGNRF